LDFKLPRIEAVDWHQHVHGARQQAQCLVIVQPQIVAEPDNRNSIIHRSLPRVAMPRAIIIVVEFQSLVAAPSTRSKRGAYHLLLPSMGYFS
jgi:hypothetical protein